MAILQLTIPAGQVPLWVDAYGRDYDDQIQAGNIQATDDQAANYYPTKRSWAIKKFEEYNELYVKKYHTNLAKQQIAAIDVTVTGSEA